MSALLDDPAALHEWWQRVTANGTPLVEPWRDDSQLVTFLWRGSARSTRVWWGLDVPLERMRGNDLWYATRVLPSDLSTAYCLVHDGVETLPRDASGRGPAHLDAHNPARLRFPADPGDPGDHDVWVSALTLPDAPPEPWLAPRPGVSPGELTRAPFGREVVVYQPAGTPAAGLPVLVVFDGWVAREVQHVPAVLDNLIAAGEIPPLVALFVSSHAADRDDELSPAGAMPGFVTGELLPWARTTLEAGLDARANMITGASRGGLTAAHIALTAPGNFGAVISQSGSFWWPGEAPGQLIREVARRPLADVRFYLDVGIFETFPAPGGAPSQIDMNRAMRDALRKRGYSVTYAEYSGGHDYVNWRRTFADGLIAVAGVRA
ncbi:enterochelin esterase family protein [Actinoplanes abujensis]|uniref:Enterochelin esterase family protein n=2 Tax=Paractinoplanes abujensis TaxID=882441 RepID=A0A7W7FYW7_9ACTN|nr:alpha/beta hydrolase-fold protein [Actinoplanes abujensis]MBB4691448.1 enterochelin esterase family protein [Actinoplanes abujensis]